MSVWISELPIFTSHDSSLPFFFQPLDRDPPNGYELWQILIAASDEDGGPTSLRGSTEVVITLIDINDNAPYLDMVCDL